MTEDRRIIGQEDATWQNETALVQAAQRDIAAFSPLYAHYVDGIYSYLLTRTGQVFLLAQGRVMPTTRLT